MDAQQPDTSQKQSAVVTKIKSVQFKNRLNRIQKKAMAFIGVAFEWVKKTARRLWEFVQKNRVLSIVVCAGVLIWLAGILMRPVSLAVVDVVSVREQAHLYQTILAEQEKQEVQWRARFDAEKQELVAQDKALAVKRAKMKKAAFKKQVDALQKKVTAFQQKYQNEYTQIAMAYQAAVQQADSFVLESMAQFGKKRGIFIIIPKQAALYAADQVDLTADFIRYFDTKKFVVPYPDPQKIALPLQQ